MQSLQIDRRPPTEDIIGKSYIYLISRFGSDAGKKAGEFYTPEAVSRLLAKLAWPKPGDPICDPSCGSGTLAIDAAEVVGAEGTLHCLVKRSMALLGRPE